MTAATPDVVSGFFGDALARTRYLAAEAERLADSEFRSGTPRAVARLVTALAKKAQDSLRTEWASYRNDPEDRDTALRMARLWDGIVRKAGGHLRYLHGAGASRVPGALSRLLDAIVRELGLGESILLREKWNYNYSVNVVSIDQWYRAPLQGHLDEEELDRIFGTETNTYSIAFPALERGNILLHAAIAHEVGHLAVEEWLRQNDDDAQEVAAQILESVAALVPKPSEGQQDFELYTTRARVGQDLQRARRRFLQEYGSDVFAVELFGPAAILAMTSIAFSQGLNIEPNLSTCYPRWSARLEVALKWLENSTNGSVWSPLPTTEIHQKVRDRVSNRLNELRNSIVSATTPADRVLADADRLARGRLVELGAALAERVRAKQPPPQEILRTSFMLAKRLRQRIPPNDIGSSQLSPKPPSLSAIMNAGWFHLVDVSADLHDEDNLLAVETTDRINRLVLKAIEDVTLLRELDDFKRTTAE